MRAPRHRRKRLRDIGECDLMPRGIAQFHVPAHMLDQGSGAGRCLPSGGVPLVAKRSLCTFSKSQRHDFELATLAAVTAVPANERM